MAGRAGSPHQSSPTRCGRESYGSGARDVGLYRELNRFRFAQILDRAIRFVTTTTQNPKVERGIRSILDELVAQGRIVSWTVEIEVMPRFYGQLLAAHRPDTAGTQFEHLDSNAGDACSLLFDLLYQPDIRGAGSACASG